MPKVIEKNIRHDKMYSRSRLKQNEKIVARGTFFICRKITENLNKKVNQVKFHSDQIYYEVTL